MIAPNADPNRERPWHERSLDFDRIIRTLNDGGVEYLVSGSLAAVVHGGPLPSFEIEIVPRITDVNTERLIAALSVLGVERLGDVEEAMANRRPVERLAAGCLLVIDPWPAGSHGFDDIRFESREIEVFPGLFARVASLDDVVRMKSASRDADDLAEIPSLRYLQDVTSGR